MDENENCAGGFTQKIKILIAYWALSEVDKKCQRVSCTTTKLNEIKKKTPKNYTEMFWSNISLIICSHDGTIYNIKNFKCNLNKMSPQM